MTDFSDVRIFFCTTPINMNYSFDALIGRAQEVFDQDPTSGHLFLFLNRVVATMGDMDDNSLPNDLAECHDLDDEEKVCSCCGLPMDHIGEDVTRELEYEPAKLVAHIHWRPKYACRT